MTWAGLPKANWFGKCGILEDVRVVGAMGKVSKSENSYCPLAAVDQRLDDVRVEWIDALRKYNKPDEFRRSLHTCITTLRTVTFVLQAGKAEIPDFKPWYAKWQEQMRQDEVMRWLVDARNYIEKQGDLETCSTADATITLDWGMRICQQLSVNPFLSTLEIAESVRASVPISKEGPDSALLTVERRWVDVKLPKYEVLDALSHCYSFIAKLVEDAHKQVGIFNLCPYRKALGVLEIDPKRLKHLGGRPPCMVATREERTVMMKLSTGEELSVRTHPRTIDRKDAEKVAKHYGFDKNMEPSKTKPKKLLEEAEHWFSCGKTILVKDGYHLPIVLLGEPNPAIIQMRIDEEVDKYVMWEKIAEDVAVSGAESLIFISEAWLRVPEEKLRQKNYPYIPREGLNLIAVSKAGEFVSIIAEFKRDGDSIHFLKEDVTEKESPIEARFLEAVRKVWTSKKEDGATKFELPRVAFVKLPWLKDENTKCPCGSGASFADCCKAYVPGGGELFKEVEQSDNINEMEKAYRGALTKYIGNVVRYTIPAFEKFPEKVAQLANVDVKVLSDLSENLALCLDRQGHAAEAIGLFRHLRETVKLPGFDKHMLYMEAIWYDAKLGDRMKARDTLRGIDIEHEDDTEVIQLYIDLFELDPEQKLILVDRILEATSLPSVALHYGALKSICLHMQGRNDEALEVITTAIDRYAIDAKHVPEHFYMNVCGRAYGMKWRLTQDDSDFRKAVEYYNTLKYKEFTPIGRASLYREVAELYSAHGDYGKALKHYKLSLKAEMSEVSIIHLGECYIYKGKLRKARRILGRISFEGLEDMYRLEFLRTQALLAIKTCDKELVEDTIQKLSLLGTCNEYFEKQRKELIDELRGQNRPSVCS